MPPYVTELLPVGDCDSRLAFAGPPIPSKHDHVLPGQGAIPSVGAVLDHRLPLRQGEAVMLWPPTATLLQLVQAGAIPATAPAIGHRGEAGAASAFRRIRGKLGCPGRPAVSCASRPLRKPRSAR